MSIAGVITKLTLRAWVFERRPTGLQRTVRDRKNITAFVPASRQVRQVRGRAAELARAAGNANKARLLLTPRWSSRHFPKVEKVLTYPRYRGG